jgi:asparagine synthase (glutamine-hydrolysing)
MPGIAGIIGRLPPDECQSLLQTMTETMKHQHCYVSGTRLAPEIGVYGAWVAHDNSFSARQNVLGKENEAVLLFSGECFPSSEHSSKFLRSGRRTGIGDVGALLLLYEAQGESFITGLNGLFSGLLIDPNRKRALLFNDRYGSERIYYCEIRGTTFFASEAKALLSVLPELRALDNQGVAQFLSYGSTLDGRTLFHKVQLLPGGSLWTFDGSASGVKNQYFRPEVWESLPALTKDVFDLKFEETFRRIVPGYLTSDSTVGISLTGGLDTRMIMACIPTAGVNLVCYTFGGLTGETEDSRLGALVARTCGLEHHALRIGADFLPNYGRYVDRTVFVTDGSASAMGAHEIYLTALARQFSPVRLTGNFGSEILRSVSTFKPLGLASELIDKTFKTILAACARPVTEADVHPVTFAAFREIPWHLCGTLVAGRTQLTFRTPYLDNEIVSLAYQAPASSRNSPRSAVRFVTNTNPRLAGIPTDRAVMSDRGILFPMKRFFAEATFKLDYLHTEGLPHWLSPLDPSIGSLSKVGLLGLHKYLPYRSWFRRELAPYIADVITDAQTRRMPYWNPRFLTSVVADHVRGRRNYVREINAILTLEAAERLFVRGSWDESVGT